MADGTASGPRARLLTAARQCLLGNGFAGFSTRAVADAAGVPLSQIHYHFGSKHQMVLALLEAENARLLTRQHALFDQDIPLWKRWEQACDALEDDLASGYVRVLQEMIAAGWSDTDVAAAVRASLAGWYQLLTGVAADAEQRFGGLGPFTAAEISALAVHAFLGAEAVILLSIGEEDVPARSALRKVARVLHDLEDAAS